MKFAGLFFLNIRKQDCFLKIMLKFQKLIAHAVLVKQSRAIKIANKIWAYKRMIQALADRDNKAKQSNQVSEPAAS